MNTTEKKIYFIRFADVAEVQRQKLVSQFIFAGPGWVLVAMTDAQRQAYPFPIEPYVDGQPHGPSFDNVCKP